MRTVTLAVLVLSLLACTGLATDDVEEVEGIEEVEDDAPNERRRRDPKRRKGNDGGADDGDDQPSDEPDGDDDEAGGGSGDGSGGGGGGTSGDTPPDGIDQVNSTTWDVKKRLVRGWKDDPDSLARVDEKGKGWEIKHSRHRDAFHLGMRNGDVITQVNGYELDTQLKLLAALAALDDEDDFRVKFKRDGTKLTHRYHVK